MDPAQAIGTPLLTASVAAITVIYAAAVTWMTRSIYRMTPELAQVQLFRKLRTLQNSILFMGLGLIIGMVLMTLFVSAVDMPDLAWAAGGVIAGIFFWYGLVTYSTVFHVPRSPAKKP